MIKTDPYACGELHQRSSVVRLSGVDRYLLDKMKRGVVQEFYKLPPKNYSITIYQK